MGMSITNMVRSEALKNVVIALEQYNDKYSGREWLADCCDLVSTSGYDNDGCTGPELVDNGVKLGMLARELDKNAQVFYAFGNPDECGQKCAYYQVGINEEDAVRRLKEALAEDGFDKGILGLQ